MIVLLDSLLVLITTATGALVGHAAIGLYVGIALALIALTMNSEPPRLP